MVPALFFSEKGILKVSLFMGLTEKTLRIGDNLADDKWHALKFERRGMVMSLGVDHHRPVIGKFVTGGTAGANCLRMAFQLPFPPNTRNGIE